MAVERQATRDIPNDVTFDRWRGRGVGTISERPVERRVFCVDYPR